MIRSFLVLVVSLSTFAAHAADTQPPPVVDDYAVAYQSLHQSCEEADFKVRVAAAMQIRTLQAEVARLTEENRASTDTKAPPSQPNGLPK